MTSTRRAAVLGGNRIPFARASGAVRARRRNQDMLTAALDGLVARFGLAGERIGEVAAGAVLKHSRDFNLTREAVLGSALVADHPRLRRAAGLRHRARDRDPRRQQDRARPGRVRHRRRRRLRVGRPDRRERGAAPQTLLRAEPRQDRRTSGQGGRSRVRPRTSVPVAPRNAEPRTGLSMGEHMAHHRRSSGASPGRPRTSWPWPATSNLAAAYDAGFFDDLRHPLPRA